MKRTIKVICGKTITAVRQMLNMDRRVAMIPVEFERRRTCWKEVEENFKQTSEDFGKTMVRFLDGGREGGK